MQTALETELAKYLPDAELKQILAAGSKATYIMSLQSKTIKLLFASQTIVVTQFVDMQRPIKDLLLQQGRCERIKDFPYPRQYATVTSFFIKLFCLLLPFGLLREFDKLNESVEGVLKGNMVWLVIPFSVLISWMYTSLYRVGESTENPFDRSANDPDLPNVPNRGNRFAGHAWRNRLAAAIETKRQYRTVIADSDERRQ